MAPPDLPAVWSGALQLGLDLDEEARARLSRYAGFLLERGGLTGATAVTDLAGIQARHLLESLALLASVRAAVPLPRGARVADVGSGAGLPGIPFAILLPECHVVLIEATGRKAGFLRGAAGILELPLLEVVSERAETLGRNPAHRETFDLVISRAVAVLPALAELCLPLLRVGGTMAALKGSRAAAEASAAARAVALLGGGPIVLAPAPVPGGLDSLSVALVLKTSPTPEQYPRRPGIPGKRPL